MSTPEHRFEVPPEYAEVYERAYRRAYEQGQGQLGGTLTEAPARRPGYRGKRVAVPQQRTSRRATPDRTGQRPGQHLAPAPVQPPVQRSARHSSSRGTKGPRVIPPAAEAAREVGHRAAPRGGSTLYPLAGLVVLAALLMVGAFLLGRVTASTVSEPGGLRTGTLPAVTASATQGSPSATPTGSATPSPTPEVYRGPFAPMRIDTARARCTARPARDGRHRRVSYAAHNVLDRDARTAWACAGRAIGQEVVLTLPRRSKVVLVGLAPGQARLAGKGRRAQNDNQLTKVAWIFDDHSRVVQTLGGRSRDHSLRRMRIVPVETRRVRLKILAVTRGRRNLTLVSTVRLGEAAPGAD